MFWGRVTPLLLHAYVPRALGSHPGPLADLESGHLGDGIRGRCHLWVLRLGICPLQVGRHACTGCWGNRGTLTGRFNKGAMCGGVSEVRKLRGWGGT